MLAEDPELRSTLDAYSVRSVNRIVAGSDITLVVNLSDQLLEQVFKGRNPFHNPVFVHDYGKLVPFLAKRRNGVIQRLGLGDKIRGPAKGSDFLLRF